MLSPPGRGGRFPLRFYAGLRANAGAASADGGIEQIGER